MLLVTLGRSDRKREERASATENVPDVSDNPSYSCGNVAFHLGDHELSASPRTPRLYLTIRGGKMTHFLFLNAILWSAVLLRFFKLGTLPTLLKLPT